MALLDEPVSAAPGALREVLMTGGQSMLAIKTILHPTDFSESSKHAMTYAISFAQEFQAKLVLLHVI